MNHTFVDVWHRYFSISFSFSEGTVFAYKTGFLKSGAVLCSVRIHRIVQERIQTSLRADSTGLPKSNWVEWKIENSLGVNFQFSIQLNSISVNQCKPVESARRLIQTGFTGFKNPVRLFEKSYPLRTRDSLLLNRKEMFTWKQWLRLSSRWLLGLLRWRFLSMWSSCALNKEANICFLMNKWWWTGFCFALWYMAWKQKHRENISHLINKGGFICLRHNLCRTGLHHYYCTTESIHKSLKPLVDESETSHHIVLSVVRESETCHKKSQPSQKKSETCVNCVILSTSWLWWLWCVMCDIFDVSPPNTAE